MLVTPTDHKRVREEGEAFLRKTMRQLLRDGLADELIESHWRGQVAQGAREIADIVDPRAAAQILRDAADRIGGEDRRREGAVATAVLDVLGTGAQVMMIRALFAAGFDTLSIAAFTRSGLDEAAVAHLRLTRILDLTVEEQIA